MKAVAIAFGGKAIVENIFALPTPMAPLSPASKAANVDSAKMLALDVADLLYGDAAKGREIAALPCRMTKEQYLNRMRQYSSRIEFA